MIQAKLISGGAELFASFYHESNNKQVAYQKVVNQADAERLVYFYNRNHLAKTMINWLKQRKYALMLANSSNAQKAYYLLVEVQNLQFGTFRTLEKFVRDNMNLFLACAPGEKSKIHYPYYLKQVKPLLDFCSK